MPNRREFLKDFARASAGLIFMGCGSADAAREFRQSGARRRREVRIAGERVRTVDVHIHCYLPEAWELVKHHESGKSPLDNPSLGHILNLHNVDNRLAQMDQRGIDVAALSFNPPNWYWADRDLASRICRLQNEILAQVCAAHPDRFVGFGAVALQHPDLAAQQLEEAVKKLGMRGTLIGGSINGEDLSAPKFHPFWAKAEELQALVFIHPQGFPQGEARFRGNGRLTNLIGNPLETTTALSHLIWDGTLDRFPRIKILAAHAGGFLPSYIGRWDQCAKIDPEQCKPVKKLPSEYLKQLYYDTLIFTNEGMRHLIAEVGVSQIVLGTDGPGDWQEDAVDFVLGVPGLSNADRKAILGATAEKLLQIGL